jgi:hypothetical protein
LKKNIFSDELFYMTLILLWFSGIISALLASSLGGGACFNLPGIIAFIK